MRARPIWARFRVRLAAAILLAALVPIASIAVVALTAARSRLEDAAVRLNATVLDGLAANLALFSAQRCADLEAVARDPRVESLDPARVEPVLQAFMVDEPFFHRLELVDPAGVRLAADARGRPADPAGPLPEPFAAGLAEARLSGRATVVALVAGDDRAAAGAATAPAPGSRPSSALRAWLVPVRGLADRGPPRAFLVGTALLHGAEVQELLDASGGSEDGFVAIVDERGRVLARRGAGLDPAVRAFTPEARFARPSGGSAAPDRPLVLADAPGTALVSLVWSPSLSAWILRGEPWDRAFALVTTLGESFAAALAIALVLAAAAAAWLSRRLGEPIAALAAAIGSLREGALAVRLEVDGEDELAEAAAAFNDLATSLQKRALVGAAWDELKKGPVPPP